jgi:hypothetical protein
MKKPIVQIMFYCATIGSVLALLCMAGCSLGQPKTREECVAEYHVSAAGTDRAVRAGYAYCDRLIEGDKEVDDVNVKCILRGIADIKTDLGLQLLFQQCRA